MKLKLPWSWQFLLDHIPYVGLASALRLRAAVARNGNGNPRPELVCIRMKKPIRSDVWLRERGSDFGTLQEVLMRGIYATILQRVGQCEYAFDLGANIGITSLLFLQHYPTCKVLAVEPSSENSVVLAKNLSALVVGGRCQILEAAVWNEDTTVDLSPPPEGTEFNAIRIQAGETGALRQPVAAYTIDTLLKMAAFPRIDLLKIDIEGAESSIFRGSTSWLAKVNAISIEFHGESRVDSGFDAVVKAAGFVIEDDEVPHCAVAYRRAGEWVI